MSKSLAFPDDVRPDFPGFSDKALAFFTGLAAHNDRTWFQERKELYDTEVKFAMECLLGEFVPARRGAALPVRGDPKRGMFRIYRDVRFSKDKQPYKTHAGAVLTRSGAKGDPGIVYIHVEPGASFLSAGFYAIERDFLTAWRTRMAERPDEFLDLVAPFAGARGKYKLRHRGSLKTMPRGFQQHADGPVADYLKWQHFLISRRLTDKQVQSPKLVDAIAEMAEVGRPLLDYGWDIFETAFADDPRRHMRVEKT